MFQKNLTRRLRSLDAHGFAPKRRGPRRYLDERKAPDDPGPDALSQCKLDCQSPQSPNFKHMIVFGPRH